MVKSNPEGANNADGHGVTVPTGVTTDSVVSINGLPQRSRYSLATALLPAACPAALPFTFSTTPPTCTVVTQHTAQPPPR